MPSFLLVIILALLLSVKAQDTIDDCQIEIEDRVYDALRRAESDGDLCKINGDKIGPYQISISYYDDAVRFNMRLLNGGMYS